jgi:hypothetical protein
MALRHPTDTLQEAISLFGQMTESVYVCVFVCVRACVRA